MGEEKRSSQKEEKNCGLSSERQNRHFARQRRVAVNPSPRQVTESKKETTHRYDTDQLLYPRSSCFDDRRGSAGKLGDEIGGSRKEEKKGKKEEGRV